MLSAECPYLLRTLKEVEKNVEEERSKRGLVFFQVGDDSTR